jgi:hypothetical protein
MRCFCGIRRLCVVLMCFFSEENKQKRRFQFFLIIVNKFQKNYYDS